MQKENEMFCSFCGKSQLQVKRLIASPEGSSFICDECIDICREIMKENNIIKTSDRKIKLLTPEQIKKHLDDYIIGQEDAKRV